MFNQFFYHETIRRTVIAFGSLFSNVQLVRYNEDGTEAQRLLVPIAYAQKEKYVFRSQEQATLTNLTQVDLPRLSFEIGSYQYDGRRKVNSVNALRSVNGQAVKQHPPVPYNVGLKLNLYTKTQEDALMVLEQLLPMFTPEYNVTITAVEELGIRQDVPIQLNTVAIETIYSTEHSEVKLIIHTLDFTAKLNLFGPVTPVKPIKVVDVGVATTIDRFNNNFYDGTYNVAVVPKEANKEDTHTLSEVSTL